MIIHKGCKILQKGKKERNSPVPQSGATGSVDGEDKKGKVKQENSYEKIFLTINRQGKLFRAIEKGHFLKLVTNCSTPGTYNCEALVLSVSA